MSTTAQPRPVTPVGILTAILTKVRGQLAVVEGLDAGVLEDLDRAHVLAGGLEPYLGACTTPESSALARLAAATQREDWAARSSAGSGPDLEQEMLSGHVEGQMLKFLVHLTRARRVLDIGLFTGYSALAMAEALPADGTVIACEVHSGVPEFARRHLDQTDHGHQVRIEVAPAAETLARLAAEGETFELVFLDADKAGYADYLDLVLTGDLLTTGGLVAVDNTLLQGQPYLPGPRTANGAAIASFNEAVAADSRVEQVLLPLRDGLTLIRRVS
jgi:caffeoyl-CoA O-methyltransferase